MRVCYFLFAIVVGITNRNLPGCARNREIACILERRPFLQQVIGDEPEVVALRENGGLLLPRTVFEAECDLSRDLIAASNLGQVTCRDCDAVQRAEYEKTVNEALSVAHRDRRRRRPRAGKDRGGNQQNSENAAAQNSNLLCTRDGTVPSMRLPPGVVGNAHSTASPSPLFFCDPIANDHSRLKLHFQATP